jgi:hypothetical protein
MESVEILNERLLREFGKFDNGLPNYRIVFSDDEFEKRWVDCTPEGFLLPDKVVELRPKYRQYIHGKHILERILPVIEGIETDLVENFSYEPLWVFHDKDDNPLPPNWDVILLVIDSVNKQSAKSVGAKYKDPESIPEEAIEIRKKRLDKLHEELFGDETEIGDALAYKYGVTVPTNYGD